ncbi:MAG: nucleotidyltransferase domain-containing protein [Metallosphaera sp.]|nr:nucleotidyltransferase domain-containing protein [Metallosphaera cuprina]
MQVTYESIRWENLKKLRETALDILNKLEQGSMKGYVYGSVARGDVKPNSDVDVIVPSPNIIWLDLIDADHKFIIQATPNSTPKAYIALDSEERKVISFPLAELKPSEEEFYRFGGIIDKNQLIKGIRIPGINKDLELIIPNEVGHEAIPLEGNEDLAVKLTGVSITTILQRERLLNRRKEKGRTGTFLSYVLRPEESIQSAVRDLFKENKFFRRKIDRLGNKR